ncbi:hypothetical protein GDO86_013712 [Hymenochirus boettgeri]|uniref:Uncharacterized protein n=1 Tax=Hymenochirus boettgeri TaxID=247094 RepID=A0A8T2JL08_9PIPI|nr:hypothetical protein GDO86_013712 [Hymenochirus boettgeri]
MAMNKLKVQMDTMKLDMQRVHAAQTEETLQKANSRLKQIERESNEKLSRATQTISELQSSISSMREENSRQQLNFERKLQEISRKHEEDKRKLMKENKMAVKVLKDEGAKYYQELRMMEKRFQDKELLMQEQVTQIRQDYELKIKGLMPAAMRQELEDTITSLKSQVNFLQKRAQVLQEAIDLHHSQRL